MMLRAAFVLPGTVVEELRTLAGRLGALPGVRAEHCDHLDVRIALLGNVLADDARRLADAVAHELATVAVPVVRTGDLEVRPDGDVAIGLLGDIDVLADVARTVGRAAERIHIYVDRRSFQPAVVVASLGTQRPGSRVASFVGAIRPADVGAWPLDEIALIRTRWFAGGAVSEVVERAPIGSGSGAGDALGA